MPYIIDPKTGKKIEIDPITGQPVQSSASAATMDTSSPDFAASQTDREKRTYAAPETGIKPLDAFARFGENAQYDMGEMWSGLKQLPGYVKNQVQEKGLVGGVAQVGKDILTGTIDEYANLIKNPGKQLYERPASTFLDLLPLAQMAKANALSKATKAATAAEKAAGAAATTEKVVNAADKFKIQPFKGAFQPEIAAKAATLGIDELPASAETTSRVVKGGEALVKKGFFGGKIASVEDDALRRINTAKDNLVASVDKPNVKATGIDIQKGFQDFTDTFNKNKTILYDKAKTPALETAPVDLTNTRAALQEIIAQKGNSAVPDATVDFYKEILDNLDQRQKLSPVQTEVGATAFRGVPVKTVAETLPYFETTRSKGFFNSLNRLSSEYGLDNPTIDRTAGVWEGAIEPSFSTKVTGTLDDARKYAAQHGAKYNQDAVVLFTKGQGTGVKYEFTVANPDAAIKAMQESGVSGGTIQGNKLTILDGDGSWKNGIMDLEKKLNAKPTATAGTIEFITKDAYPTYTGKAGSGDLLHADLQTAGQKTEPLNYAALKQTRSSIGQKMANFNDPVATGDKASMTRLYAALSEDLDNTIATADPKTFKAIETANEYYKQTIEKINSSYGKKIANENPEALVDQLVKPNSETTVSLVKEVIGPEATVKLQKAFASKLVTESLDNNGHLDLTKFDRNINKYTEPTIQALLDEKQFNNLKEIQSQAKVINDVESAIKAGIKPAEGSQTAFLQRMGALSAGFAINPGLTIKALIGDYAVSKLFTTKAGKALLTSGLEVTKPDLSKAANVAKSMTPAIPIAAGIPNNAGPTFASGESALPNIDLSNRPQVTNADGSISTVLSKSFSIDGKEVLLPTVVGGKVVSDAEAIQHYKDTGENLGKFNSIAEANKAAKLIHDQQEAQIDETVTIKNSKTGETKTINKSDLGTYGLGDSGTSADPITKAFGGQSKTEILTKMAQQGSTLKQLQKAKSYLDIIMPDTKEKALTSTQIRDVNLANNGLRGLKVVIDEISKPDGSVDMGKINSMRVAPQRIGYKKLYNAIFDATGARLRIESGAAISSDEIKRYVDDYFLQLFDSPDSVKYEIQQMYLFLNATKEQKPAQPDVAATPTFDTGNGSIFSQ